MTTDWPQCLRSAWAEISLHPAHARQFRSRRLSSALRLDAHAGMRSPDDAPCLMIETVLDGRRQFEVGGMRLASVLGDNGPLAVLSLEDPARTDLFTTVCADALQVAEGAPENGELEVILARLEAWRQFLRERRSGLGRNDVVGLLGELLILQKLLELNAALLPAWRSPDDGLHDFEHGGHSLEVKATLGLATLIHISTLDQLDPAGTHLLHLLHIRLVEAPDGQSLGDVAQLVRLLLVDENDRRAFDNALLRRGLMPDDAGARAAPKVGVRDLSAYLVDATFPKLIRASVPSAVNDATYSLDVRRIALHTADPDAVVHLFVATGQP